MKSTPRPWREPVVKVSSFRPGVITSAQVEEIRAKRAEAHRRYYHEPRALDGYEAGLRWGVLSTLDMVLGIIDPKPER